MVFAFKYEVFFWSVKLKKTSSMANSALYHRFDVLIILSTTTNLYIYDEISKHTNL